MVEIQPEIIDAERFHVLEQKVHGLEVEKRIMVIRMHNATFDGKDKSIDYLEGYMDAVKLNKTDVKQHNVNVADVVSKASKATRIGLAINEDDSIAPESDL